MACKTCLNRSRHSAFHTYLGSRSGAVTMKLRRSQCGEGACRGGEAAAVGAGLHAVCVSFVYTESQMPCKTCLASSRGSAFYTFFGSRSGAMPGKLPRSQHQERSSRGGGLENNTSTVGRHAAAPRTMPRVHGRCHTVAIRPPAQPLVVAAAPRNTRTLSWAWGRRAGVLRRARDSQIGKIWLIHVSFEHASTRSRRFA